jgi:hypothetical protein
MSNMPKKINPEVRARAVRLVADHLGEYPSLTAASAAVAKQVVSVMRACAGGFCRPRSMGANVFDASPVVPGSVH